MYLYALFRGFLAFPLISIVTSSPTPLNFNSALQTRAVDCSDPQTFDESCWATLNIGDFLNNPTTGWNITHTCTGTAADGLSCCAANEAWSTCFLRLALGTAGYDCTEINVHSCNNLYSLNPALHPEDQAKYRYILKNIYGSCSCSPASPNE